MRYEMRLLDNGWTVWDTETNASTASGSVADDLVALLNAVDGKATTPAPFPPPEEDLGGGDICSLEAEPSTEDDKPLD